jgi:hypothetical protein
VAVKCGVNTLLPVLALERANTCRDAPLHGSLIDHDSYLHVSIRSNADNLLMIMSAQFLAAIQIPQAAATLRGIRREVEIMRHGAFGEPLRLGCAAYLSRSTRCAGQLAAPYRASQQSNYVQLSPSPKLSCLKSLHLNIDTNNLYGSDI